MRIRILGGWLFALLAILLLAQATHAQPPPPPFRPYGTAKIDGEYLAEGTLVGAGCGEGEYVSTPVTMIDGESWYFIDVPADGCAAGETVGFTIDGLTADQTTAWQSGVSYRLDLTAIRPNPSIDVEKHTNGVDADGFPGPYVLVGDPVSWSYTFTNTGNVTLTNVTLTDDPLGELFTISALGPDASETWAEGGVAAVGQYSNTGTVTGTPPGGLPDVSDADSSHYFGAQPEIQIEKYTNGQDADSAPGVYIILEETVTWTYVVSNTGNVTLTNVSVVDDLLGGVTCLSTTLAPGESTTCEEWGMAGAGQYSNTGTATGTPPGGLAEVYDNDPSRYFGIYASMDMEKYTNGQDADSAPGMYIPVGEPVAWTYLITNTGNVTLTNVLVSDDQGVEVNCGQDTLAPDESMTCEAAGTAELGQYSNLGSVAGTPPVGPDVGASDPSFYFGVEPSLALEKYTNDQDADGEPGPIILSGDAVTWTYTISNTGNVTLTDVTLTDDQEGTIGCPASTLVPGQSMACETTGAAQSGQYGNEGTATGTPPGGLTDVSATDPSHYFGASPAIALEKQTNGQDADSPPGAYIPVGDPVTWTYVITNTGNVTLTNIGVEDSQPGLSVSCPQSTLGQGESMSCTASGTAEVGQYGNLGSVSGTPPVGPDVTAYDLSFHFGAEPSIDIEKNTEDQDADVAPGPYIAVTEAVTWTYLVTNTGNVVLTDIAIVDDQFEEDVCEIAVLEPDQGDYCYKSGIAGVGQFKNVGTVTATAPGGLADVSDSDPSHYFGIYPSIDIEKHTNGQDADSAPGVYIPVDDPVTWTYVITNTGNITLTNVTVEDSQPGVSVSCPENELAENESVSCSATGTAQLGQYGNVGSVSATPPIGPDVGDSDPSFYFGAQTSIDIEKYTNGIDADEPPGFYLLAGEPVTWTYVVTNTGNVTLTNVIISDDQGVEITCPQDTLAPQESITCTAGGTAGPDQYVNQGTASGKPVGGLADLIAEDRSHYFGLNPSITIEKYTNDYDADQPPGPEILVGEPVTWTYVISNTGNVLLTDVVVEDTQPGVIVSCPQATLAVGESITCSASGSASSGQYANEGTVTGYYGATMAEGRDPSHYLGADPDIHTKKYVSIDGGVTWQDADEPPGPEVFGGSDLYFSIWVTNTGNIELMGEEISLEDSDFDVSGCAVPYSLLPSQSFECVVGPFEVLGGQHTNTFTVSVAYSDDCSTTATPTDQDVANYSGIETFYAYVPLALKSGLR